MDAHFHLVDQRGSQSPTCASEAERCSPLLLGVDAVHGLRLVLHLHRVGQRLLVRLAEQALERERLAERRQDLRLADGLGARCDLSRA